uniref:Putative neuropeptide n=1 Tax=Helix lucorum TaxID=31229 RepID=Q25160_HELLU|nr:putative neuropeptide precursor [Helix lucorum]
MGRVRLCLCVSLVISCLAQVGMFVPIILDVDLDFDTNPLLKVADGVLEPMDTNDLTVLPSRSRRTLPPWLSGTGQSNRNLTNVHPLMNRRFRNNNVIVVAHS